MNVSVFDSNPKSILTPHINGDLDYEEGSSYPSNDVEEEEE